MEAIIKFINEMRRSEWGGDLSFSERMYNGIKVIQSEQSYYNFLMPLYNSAVIELISIPNDKLSVLSKLIVEIEETQEYFELPSEELLSSLLNDYHNSHNQIKSLKEDYDYLIFVKRCMKIQKSFFENFKNKIISTNEQPIKEKECVVKINPPSKDREVVKGVKGLANFLNKGVTTAQAILNSGILQKEGIAFRVGNGWNIDAKKLTNLLAENPDLLSRKGK